MHITGTRCIITLGVRLRSRKRDKCFRKFRGIQSNRNGRVLHPGPRRAGLIAFYRMAIPSVVLTYIAYERMRYHETLLLYLCLTNVDALLLYAQFRIGVLHDGELVQDWKTMGLTYLGGWFLLDFISTMGAVLARLVGDSFAFLRNDPRLDNRRRRTRNGSSCSLLQALLHHALHNACLRVHSLSTCIG